MSSPQAFINLRVGHYRLRAGLWPTLATLLLLPLLVALGVWQLGRAEQKTRLQAEYDRQAAEPPLVLAPVIEPAERLQYRRVTVRGEYEPRYQILLDNRVHQGQVGYHVLTPLRIGDGSVRVLVNRGWVPLGADRSVLPRLDTPAGPVEVTGVATVPQTRGFHLGAAVMPGSDWSTVWQYLDLDEYARRVPFPLQPAVVLLDADSPAGGFTRQWLRLDSGIATHQGYAFQWFSLAVALAAIYILVNTRRDHDADHSPDPRP